MLETFWAATCEETKVWFILSVLSLWETSYSLIKFINNSMQTKLRTEVGSDLWSCCSYCHIVACVAKWCWGLVGVRFLFLIELVDKTRGMFLEAERTLAFTSGLVARMRLRKKLVTLLSAASSTSSVELWTTNQTSTQFLCIIFYATLNIKLF